MIIFTMYVPFELNHASSYSECKGIVANVEHHFWKLQSSTHSATNDEHREICGEVMLAVGESALSISR